MKIKSWHCVKCDDFMAVYVRVCVCLCWLNPNGGYLCIICISLPSCQSFLYMQSRSTHIKYVHVPLAPLLFLSIWCKELGLSSAPVVGLWGAAGLPVDSHIRSYSLHRNTIIQWVTKQAPQVEYWCRTRASARQAQRGLRNMEARGWIPKDALCKT